MSHTRKKKFNEGFIQSQIEEPVKIMKYFEIVKKQIKDIIDSDDISNVKNLKVQAILEKCETNEHSFCIEVIQGKERHVNLRFCLKCGYGELVNC